MAKKPEPELFSANLFTTSGTEGEDSFAFGESSGKLPAAQILFTEPVSGSAVDPFAQLSNPPSNDASFGSSAAPSGPEAGVPPRSLGSDPVSTGARSAAESAASFTPSLDAPSAGVGGMMTTGSMGVQPQPVSSALTHADSIDAYGPTGTLGFQPHAAPVAENVATIPVTMIGSSSTVSGTPGSNQFSQQQPLPPPMLSASDAHQFTPHSGHSGPTLMSSAPYTGFASPHAGFSGPQITAPGSAPVSDPPVPPTTYGSGYGQGSVMEPVDMSSTAGGSGLVGFGEGGFPVQGSGVSAPLSGASQEPSWVSPPQTSAVMQPLQGEVPASAAGGAPNPYAGFQPPMAMNPLPVEQEWRAQQEMVQSQVPPLQFHWFYCKADKWIPFSLSDSSRLEEAHHNSLTSTMDVSSFVPTEGGRYDVELETRQRHSVYWDEPTCEVRRSSWFYKGDPASDFSPYREDEAEALEVSSWCCRFMLECEGLTNELWADTAKHTGL